MSKRIFIIDDELDSILAARVVLEENGYIVGSESDPKKGINRIKTSPPDLLLLDIRMPEMDGFEVCKTLKSEPATKHLPIIMLSVQAQEADVVVGLEMGAEDYIRKPFRKRELLARVKVALRRHEEEKPRENKLHLGPLKIDFDSYSATINETSLFLEPKEFQLLVFFAKNQGRVLTRGVIAENVWNTMHLPSSRAIDVRVNELKKKLGTRGEWIQGLRGIGYRFEIEE